MRSEQYLPHLTTPWSKCLDLEILGSDAQVATMRLPWRLDLTFFDEQEVLASGAIATVIDQACGLVVTNRLGTRGAISTLNLKIDHIRPAAPRASVTVEARCLHLSRTIAFVRAEVWDTSPDALVAIAQGSFACRGHGGSSARS
ncbi:PaaI family thioesterase [Sphingopyxis sp.]|uniref:PaaI family thioesterase n=1 Tax=Sphingopyxis sp. TaxID=1908224 RepID=UPI0035B39E45